MAGPTLYVGSQLFGLSTSEMLSARAAEGRHAHPSVNCVLAMVGCPQPGTLVAGCTATVGGPPQGRTNCKLKNPPVYADLSLGQRSAIASLVKPGGWSWVRHNTGRHLLRANTPTTNDLFAHKKNRATAVRDRLRISTPTSGTGRREFKRDQANARRLSEEAELRIRRTIDNRSLDIHFQPIVNLKTGHPLGIEALSRFTEGPKRSPDLWFAEAASVGLGTELEIAAIELALAEMNRLPANMYMSINASVETILSDQFRESLAVVQAERVVLEVTEHTPIANYGAFATSISGLRSRGVRIAVDDAGAGYAGFGHLLDLKPDIIKLDITLTRGIDRDPARQALGRALLRFGFEVYQTTMIAEGIETNEELATLRSLGCPLGQGFVLGRPNRLPPLPLLPPLPPLVLSDRVPELTDSRLVTAAGPVLVIADEEPTQAVSRESQLYDLLHSSS